MTNSELQQMGLTREQWNEMLEEEEMYTQNWSQTVDKNKL